MAQQQQHTGRLAAPSASGNDNKSDAATTASMQPSSTDLEQAMAHLSRIASLLDSRSAASSSSSTQHPQPQPQPQGFPGLIDVVPHLLNPLVDITRAASGSNGGNSSSAVAPSGSGGSIQPASSAMGQPTSLGVAHTSGQGGPAQEPQLPHPSAIVATYRPLVMQVRALLSQLGGCVAAAAAPIEQQTSMPNQASSSSSNATSSSLQVAEWAHDRRCRRRQKKRGREGDEDGGEREQEEGKGDTKSTAMSKEEKREAILRARKLRRQREAGVGREEQPQPPSGPLGAGPMSGEPAQGVETKADEAAQGNGQQQQAQPQQSLDTAMAEGGPISGGQAHPPPPQQQSIGGTATSMG